MGYEYTQVKDFIEDKGLAEYSHDVFADAVDNNNYENPLFEKDAEEKKDHYDYYDPGLSMPPMGKAINMPN